MPDTILTATFSYLFQHSRQCHEVSYDFTEKYSSTERVSNLTSAIAGK